MSKAKAKKLDHTKRATAKPINKMYGRPNANLPDRRAAAKQGRHGRRI